MTKSKPNGGEQALPPGVEEGDLKYPEAAQRIPYGELESLGYQGALTFYLTDHFGWVLCALPISHSGPPAAAGQNARTYAVGAVDGKVYRVGGRKGQREVRVYVSRANLERLQRYCDLYAQGEGDAQGIRDRISSRRVQGQLHRQQGRTSWTW